MNFQHDGLHVADLKLVLAPPGFDETAAKQTGRDSVLYCMSWTPDTVRNTLADHQSLNTSVNRTKYSRSVSVRYDELLAQTRYPLSMCLIYTVILQGRPGQRQVRARVELVPALAQRTLRTGARSNPHPLALFPT